MGFTIKDAARICYGETIANECAKHAEENDKRDKEWKNVYDAEYKNIPSFWAGSLLIEAINEQERGMNHDDMIVLAYARGDKVAAADELFKLLDWYRVQLATRAADKATNT